MYDQALARRIEAAFGVRALSASFLASPAYVAAATDESVVSVISVDRCYLSLRQEIGKRLGKKPPRAVRVEKNGSNLCLCGTDDASCGRSLYVTVQERPGRGVRHKRRQHLGGRIRNVLAHTHPSHVFRSAVDGWRRTSAISKGLLTALLAVFFVSIGLFSCTGGMTPLDALYFVVTTMTTVGYGDFNLQHAPPGLKVYGVLMMLSGATLLATLYAIIADHVLSARINYLLGRHEVNLRDHTVVVGLGKVGYRVAHDLAMLGVDVTAVEIDGDSDNISAARSMFPVVIGDASRESVLHKAALDRAAAVLALTEDPLLNLSVALHARERNPEIKTVVRTYDFDVAERFRNLGLDEALSTSAIAAPAFVDAAVYPGVQGSFRFGDEDVLVARYVVSDDSPLTGRSVAAIGEEQGIAVVMIGDTKDANYRPASPDDVLQPGCRAVTLLTREKTAGLPGI